MHAGQLLIWQVVPIPSQDIGILLASQSRQLCQECSLLAPPSRAHTIQLLHMSTLLAADTQTPVCKDRVAAAPGATVLNLYIQKTIALFSLNF